MDSRAGFDAFGFYRGEDVDSEPSIVASLADGATIPRSGGFRAEFRPADSFRWPDDGGGWGRAWEPDAERGNVGGRLVDVKQEAVVVHILVAGRTLCEQPSRDVPATWPAGHVWVRATEAAMATCRECLRLASNVVADVRRNKSGRA